MALRGALRRAALVPAAALFLGLLPVGGVASAAPPPPTLTIDAPTGQGVVSGVVPVTVTMVVPEGADDPASMQVTFGPLTRGVRLAVGECRPSCTRTFSFDTVLEEGDPSTGIYRFVHDAPNSVYATTSTPYNGYIRSTIVTVPVDNDRPVVTTALLPQPQGAPYGITADKQLEVPLQVAPGPGQTVAAVAVRGLWASWPAGTVTGSGGSWTYRVDTADLDPADGGGALRVRAVDGRGVPSLPLLVPVRVHHGIPVSLDPLPDPFRGSAANYIARIAVAPLNGAEPLHLQITRDGAAWGGPTHYPYDKPGEFRVNLGGGSAGVHTFSFHVTDTRGVVTTVSQRVTVPGVTAQWTAGGGATVVEGQQVRLTAQLASAIAGEGVGNWLLRVDEGMVTYRSGCSSTCPATDIATGVWQAGRPYGPRTVDVMVNGTGGEADTHATRLTVIPATTVALAVPSAATYGSKPLMNGLVRRGDGSALAGAGVQWQRRYAGSTAWTTVTSGRTGADGRVLLTPPAAGNADWRLVVPRTAGWGGSVSAARRMSVRATVAAIQPATTVAARRTASFTVRTAPYEQGLALTVQRRVVGGAWQTLGRYAVSSSGSAWPTVYFPSAGYYDVRVVRPATGRIVATVSAPWRVRAR